MGLNRALIVVGVIAVHLLLLSGLWSVAHQALPDRPNSQVVRLDRSPTIVYLLEPPMPAGIKTPRDAQHQEARRTQTKSERNAEVAPPVYGDELSNAAVLSNTAAVPQASAEVSAEVPKPMGSSLNLTLSREAIKSLPPSLVASSPFRGRLPATMESKIADAAAATGPWTEERLDNDHILLRRGTTCITLSRPEIAKIDPFSNGIRNLPWAAGSPYECH